MWKWGRTHSVLIYNEKRKLRASWFDRLSTACLTVGVAAPIAASIFAPDQARSVPVVGLLSWILVAFALHILASLTLNGMKDA